MASKKADTAQNTTSQRKYEPIDCDFYDVLESASVRARAVVVEFTDEAGKHRAVTAEITNIESMTGGEFLFLSSGEKIRLDFLVSVNGERAPWLR